jgi:RNA polymerase sigma-70 factor (ECF subfamily)
MELASVYSELRHTLLGFIKTKVNNQEDAEDILQNVFIKVMGNIDDLSESQKLQSWIYAITRNSIIDYYRANAKKKDLSYDEGLNENFSEQENPDTTKGLDCCLIGFVNQLPGEYRDIIIDVEINGIKQKELAEKYNLAYPTIRSRVQRGRERLKQILLDCCHIKWDSRGNILDVASRNKC